MMDLWTLLIENVFGGFWITMGALAMIFFIILIIGGVSLWTILVFMGTFLLSMTIGYGHPIITVPIVIFILLYFVFEVFGFISRGGDN